MTGPVHGAVARIDTIPSRRYETGERHELHISTGRSHTIRTVNVSVHRALHAAAVDVLREEGWQLAEPWTESTPTDGAIRTSTATVVQIREEN